MALTISSPTQNYSYCNELLLLISSSLLLLYSFNYRIRLGCKIFFQNRRQKKDESFKGGKSEWYNVLPPAQYNFCRIRIIIITQIIKPNNFNQVHSDIVMIYCDKIQTTQSQVHSEKYSMIFLALGSVVKSSSKERIRTKKKNKKEETAWSAIQRLLSQFAVSHYNTRCSARTQRSVLTHNTYIMEISL